ncbi:protease IV [Methylomarinovum tepidoasis]|uniref:Protease IV n=1 Tax=Methylomarinovum tepidoasis TaxID=2840183 RepID=A0AAU9C4H3_9GAMM|nr:signal peptide peptidase SppA [Methylomarinovum sp. IN45]BCX88392.1 protease IV [Methylomarinovum sp. IN45]
MTQDTDTSWERQVLERLANETLAERRRARRWNVTIRLLFLAYLIAVTLSLMKPWSQEGLAGNAQITAKVKVEGILLPDAPANAQALIEGLRRAAKAPNAKGILLEMNSPGGSPVQAALVYDAIRRLKKEKPDLPVVAVVQDMCASGCYYIAAAADKIYVSPYSIVGSIGVIMNGFGFVEAMKKLGIERRLLTAGEHKALLDPFSPVKPEEKAHVQGLLNEVHRQFIAAVRQGRGQRLKDTPEIFSGLIWVGHQGIELGLADAIGDTYSVAREVIGAEKIVDFTPEENVWERVARRFGTSLGMMVAATVGGARLGP